MRLYRCNGTGAGVKSHICEILLGHLLLSTDDEEQEKIEYKRIDRILLVRVNELRKKLSLVAVINPVRVCQLGTVHNFQSNIFANSG